MHNIGVPEGETEWSLIWDSWARSWMKSPWSGTFRNCDWKELTRAVSQEIIDRPTTRVYVAWGETEDGTRKLKGYIVTEPSRKIIHWLYVKRDFRGQKVAKALLESALLDTDRRDWVYTHKTYACNYLLRGMKHDKSYACKK